MKSGIWQRDRQKSLAAALSCMLLLAQVVAALHFALVPHTIDAQTGKVIRYSESNDHHSEHRSSPHSGDHTPDDDAPAHQECQVYTLLLTAQTVTAPPCMALYVAMEGNTVFSVKDTDPFARQRVYLMSPAHSPPDLPFS
ncbi:MAG: hypothetical protein JXR76_00695 [Deltaproteobacteria bacterium]|nr:hypothetical protein [Deltaproteobacteria bacterium]